MLDAEIRSNPVYKKAAIEARLRAMGAKVDKEDDRDDIERGIELLQKLQTLREAAGLDPSNNPWWQDVLKEIAKNFNLGSLGQMSSTETQQPQIPAKPPTIPQPRETQRSIPGPGPRAQGSIETTSPRRGQG